VKIVPFIRRFQSPLPALVSIALVTFLALGQDTKTTSKPTTKFQETKARAEKGDAVAQFDLGNSFYNGAGVPQDYSEALKWYRKAAEQGYAAGQYNVGMCYYMDGHNYRDIIIGFPLCGQFG
jgi:hypothetical protein